jgi:predicted tellurium resistance membrane protein TerC
MPSLLDLPIGAVSVWGQHIESSDLIIVGLLVLLEGVLSIDNALVLGLLAKRLPKEKRAKALSYGLVGAFVFRFLAIATATYLMQWTLVKFVGGAYLVFIALKHLLWESREDGEEIVVVDQYGNPTLVDADTGKRLSKEREDIEIQQRTPLGASLVTDYDAPEDSGYFQPPLKDLRSAQTESKARETSHARPKRLPSFWGTVLVIELTDIAFAVDSILAAIALAGSNPAKNWVVISGGILGVVLMRFAAAVFIRLLERFPRFETSAYLLVTIIVKLLMDWGCNSDWSMSQPAWLANRLGSARASFVEFEEGRRDLVHRYESWLQSTWPLGMANAGHEPASVNGMTIARPPHLLDFHDLRRPECLTFWIAMAACFGIGFVPQRSDSKK